MAISPPMAIDQAAIHRASQIRLLAYAAVVGQEGVLGNDHLRIVQKSTPGPGIDALGGGYSVLAKHLGGEFEAYVGKFSEAESIEVSPTDSSGPRTDLVILRIENPFVSGAGVWSQPADPLNGPYTFVRVIEGVNPTTNQVGQWNADWSAITLAKITRPANKLVIEQGDITDLRSLASLGGTRTVIEQVDPPPIAQASYMQFNASEVDPGYANPIGGSDDAHDYLEADTSTKNWPVAGAFTVPVPEWARECDAEFVVYNAQLLTGEVYGDMWLDFGGTATPAQTYAVDWTGTPGRYNIGYGATFSIPSSLRGDLITVRTKFKSRFNAPGELDAKTGTVTKLVLNFQRNPDIT